jgi:hypothetical protein
MALTNEIPTNKANAVAGRAARSADNAKAGHKNKPATGDPTKVAGSSAKVAFDKVKPTAKSAHAAETKASIVLKKLRSAKGATLDALMEATGWQAHSVRGFLSGTVKKKLALALVSESGTGGARRYRIDDAAKAG